jgi:hypothetical protein
MGNIPPTIGRVPQATLENIQGVHGNVMNKMQSSNGNAPTDMISDKWGAVFGQEGCTIS